MTDEIEATRAALERSVREAGHVLTGDGRVAESTAAALLCISVSHLRRLRYHAEIEAHRLGCNGCRVSYSLLALAKFIVSTRDE